MEEQPCSSGPLKSYRSLKRTLEKLTIEDFAKAVDIQRVPARISKARVLAKGVIRSNKVRLARE
jgi:hypothetical protein